MTNEAQIAAGNQATIDDYIDLIIGVFEDPANPAMFTDAMIEEYAVKAGVMYVELVTTGDAQALFDGLLMGFLG